MRGSLTLAGDELHLRTIYNRALVNDLHHLSTARWRKPVWTIESWEVAPARAICRKHGVEIDPDVLELDGGALPETVPRLSVEIRMARRNFRISFEYDRQLVAAVRQLPEASWEKDSKCWVVPCEHVESIVAFAEYSSAVFDDAAQVVIARHAKSLRLLALSCAEASDTDFPAAMAITPMPFQRAGLEYSLEALVDGGVILGDEPGLGKTPQSLAIVEHLDAYPCVVVCPATIRPHWLDKVAEWLPHRTATAALSTRAGLEALLTVDVTVIGYDVLHAWARVFTPPRSLILDESHRIKSGGAQRTKAAITLGDRMGRASIDVVKLCLSGTPMPNRPNELISQLRFLDRFEQFAPTQKEFSRLYTPRKPQSLGLLNKHLRSRCYVRREKADVLAELPAKRWAAVPLEVPEPEMAEYRRAERDIVRFLANAAREAMLAAGATTEQARRAAWQKALRVAAARWLVEMQTLKRLSALAKLRAVSDWLEDFLESDRKVVVFGHHREVTAAIAERHCAGVAIVGGQDDATRAEAIKRFQEDPQIRAISCSITAAGIGVTLTAASDVAFIEQGWTPADMDQAIDRCHRIGQHDAVTGWLLSIPGTIDARIARLIAAKREVVDAVTVGRSVSGDVELSVLQELLEEYTEEGLGEA